MIVSNLFTDLSKTITGCRCGTEVFAISLGIFAFSLIVLFWAFITLKKAKALNSNAMGRTSTTGIASGKTNASPALPTTEKSTAHSLPQNTSQTSENSEVLLEDTVDVAVDQKENDMTEINAISPLPNLDMIPYPNESLDENDATVLMKRQKPNKKE